MDVFFIVLVGVLGLALGSFLNALLWRIREQKPFVKARSLCPRCKIQLAWYDNIPLLSFFFLQGKCRSCKKAISWQYPIVETVLALLFVFVSFHHSGAPIDWPLLIRDLGLTFLLLSIFVYDLRYKEILDWQTLWPAAIMCVCNLVFGWQSISSMALGVVFAAGFFFLQYIASAGRWIGGGDVRYGVLMGVILGSSQTLVGLLLAYVGGALVSISLVITDKKQFASETPFGTYLAVATLVALFWGSALLDWYMQLFV